MTLVRIPGHCPAARSRRCEHEEYRATPSYTPGELAITNGDGADPPGRREAFSPAS